VQLGVCCLELKHHEAAIAALRDAAENDKTNFSLQKTLAQAYAAAGLWEEAVHSYEAASRLAPDDHLLLSTLAHCARKAGSTAHAAQVLKQAIDLAPEIPQYRQELAELLAASNQLEMARTLYLEALRIAPNSVMILVGLGELYLKLKDFAEAVSVFEKAITLDPSRADIVKALGEANILLGRFDHAQTAFARAASIDPLNPDYLRRAGECLWQLARHASAIALWKKNLIQHPNDAATHAKLGAALSHQGKHLEAFAAYQRAAQESPQDVSLALETARAALSLQNFDSALPHLERASKLTPNDHNVWQMLGETYHSKNLNDRALSALEHAAQLAPHLGKPQAEMARVYLQLGKRAEANTAAEAAIELDPNSTDVLAAAAEVFVQTNRHAQGVAASRKVAKGRPDDAEALMNLTRALILEKESAPIRSFSKVEGTERAEIMNQLERAADLGADANAVNLWKARALALFGNFKEAIPLLEAAVAKTPTAEIYCALASCYRRAGKLALARKAIETSLEREPTNVNNLVERGRIILEQGDAVNARETFERVITLDPQNATAHQLLGECFQASGKRIEAANVYQKAITLDPEQAAWHHRLAELYESRRETSLAIQHYQHATELAQKQKAHPHETATYVAALARAYARLNDLAHAADQFDRALILRDDIQAWWAQCGEIHLALKNFERAWECFAHTDDLASLIGAARAALALNRNNDAQEKILAALHLNSDNADALLLLAEVYMRRADYDNALSAYGTAANVADDPRIALTAQATLLLDLDQPMKAAGALKRVLTLDPEDDEAMGMLSDALAQAKRVDEAIEAAQHANRVAPHKTSHLLRLGKLFNGVGQLDVALAHLQNAREFEPGNAEIARELGLVYERRSQPHRALELYQELIQLQPKVADNFFRAGLAAKSMRDYVEAAHFFKRAAELDPTNLEIQKQRLAVSATGILKMVSG
jgi:tetratricopeptide (TPR) repeat protein